MAEKEKKQAGRLLGRQAGRPAAITRGRKESIESRIACQTAISVEEEEEEEGGMRRKRLERLWALTRSISIITQAKAV